MRSQGDNLDRLLSADKSDNGFSLELEEAGSELVDIPIRREAQRSSCLFKSS